MSRCIIVTDKVMGMLGYVDRLKDALVDKVGNLLEYRHENVLCIATIEPSTNVVFLAYNVGLPRDGL